MTTQDRVREFHETFEHPVGENPQLLDIDRIFLRLSLIKEEFYELISSISSLQDTADALADLVYVCYGMSLEMGIDLDSVIEVVHNANMRKLGPDGKPIYREDGKILKPEGWESPNIEEELFRQGWRS